MRFSSLRSASVFIGIASALALFQACGKPFNVKTNVRLPAEARATTTIPPGVQIAATAITDEDAVHDVFDANLILAGILPVRVTVTNNSTEALSLRRTRFQLKSEPAVEFRTLDPRRAYKQLMTYYDVSAYNIAGNRKSRSDFESHALDTKAPVGAGASRDGLLFFRSAAELNRNAALVLTIKGIGSGKAAPLELRLQN